MVRGSGRPRPAEHHRLSQAQRLALELGHEIEPDGHRHLGRRRGRGRALVAREVDERGVGLVPDRGNERDRRGGRGAHHDLLVEGHQILEAAAAPRDDEEVGPRRLGPGREAVEALDRRGNLRRRALALDRHRPDQDPARKAVLEAVQNVADDGARQRGDDADHLGQERQRALPLGGEEPFGGKPHLALFQELQQSADAGKLDAVDNQLIARAPGIGGEPPGAHHLHPVLGLKAEPGVAPAHRIEHGVGVLEREIAMTGGMALEAGNLAAHADIGEILLDRALQQRGDLAHAIFGQVEPGRRGSEGAFRHRPP
jgi:hypothetical protein